MRAIEARKAEHRRAADATGSPAAAMLAAICGIGGILRVYPPEQRAMALRTPHERSIPEAWLGVLDDAIRHRGPDGHGRFRDRAVRADGSVVDVAFVHRRLSIIDHAGGHQPMVLRVPRGAPSASSGSFSTAAHPLRPAPGRLLTPEQLAAHNRRVLAEAHGPEAASPELARGPPSDHDHIAVVFNGCIYNHRDLRAELQRAGHVFGTDHSDTEVLVHGWRAWGPALFERLDGMYAAAIWDGRLGQLVLIRDPFGEKPLYQCGGSPEDSGFAFASAAPGLLHLRSRITKPSSAGDVRHWVGPWIKFGWNQAMSPIPEVREVTGGLARTVPHLPDDDPGNAGLASKLWTPSLNPTGEPLGSSQAERLVEAAVRTRLEADVPVGAYLSGGIDSALITAIAARHHRGIRAYTVRMPDGRFDESAAAAATATAVGVEHRILECDARPAEDLAAIIPQVGLPFGDSSLLPSLWVSRAAGQVVKVALAGDGGDEMFLGYDRHRAIRVLAWLGRLPRETLEALAAAMPHGGTGRPRSRRQRLSRLVNAAAASGYKELVAIFPAPLDAEIGLVPPGRTDWGVLPHYGLTNGGSDRAWVELTALRFDRFFYLPCDLMRKTDTASMAVPLEVRSPMLQTDLAWAALNAPVSSLMPRGQRKGLLRQIARKFLPSEIMDRPKMGFAIPIGEWFRTDYGGLRTMLMDHLNSTEPFGPPWLGIDLNMTFIRRMLDEHLGTGPSGLMRRDHGQRLYMLLVLSIWAKWVGALRRADG